MINTVAQGVLGRNRSLSVEQVQIHPAIAKPNILTLYDRFLKTFFSVR